jgi:hypothetical protein
VSKVCRACALPAAERAAIDEALISRSRTLEQLASEFPGLSTTGLCRHRQHLGERAAVAQVEQHGQEALARRDRASEVEEQYGAGSARALVADLLTDVDDLLDASVGNLRARALAIEAKRKIVELHGRLTGELSTGVHVDARSVTFNMSPEERRLRAEHYMRVLGWIKAPEET